MPEWCEALNSGDKWDFWGVSSPKCPHCGEDIEVPANDLYELYEEGEHDDIECPNCERTFIVSTSISYSFDTSRQEQDDND